MQEYVGALESLLQVLRVSLVENLLGHSLAPRIAAQQECAVLGWAGHTLAPRVAAQMERALQGWVGQ